MKKTILFAIMVFATLALVGCKDGRPPNEVNSIEDVPGKIIGAFAGTPSARLADELGVARVFYSGDELMYALTMGTVDCVVMESVSAEELVAENPDVRILGDTLIEYELCFAVPRENAQLLEVVNSALAELEADGTLRSLRDKYFSGKSYVYENTGDAERRPGELTLAVAPDSPPYSYKDDEGNYTGLDVEVTRAVCDRLGVQLVVSEVNVEDLVTAVWFARAHLAAGWLPGDINDQVSISDPYANTAHVVIVRK